MWLFSVRINCDMVSVILLPVLRQVHSLFQSDFSTECDLVFPLSVSSHLRRDKKNQTPTRVSL
jgi:hypothetical protein